MISRHIFKLFIFSNLSANRSISLNANITLGKPKTAIVVQLKSGNSFGNHCESPDIYSLVIN